MATSKSTSKSAAKRPTRAKAAVKPAVGTRSKARAGAGPAAAPKTAAKAKPRTAPAKTAPIGVTLPAAEARPAPRPELRKKELVARVVAATGKKPRDVKPVVEAMLAEMARAVSDGDDLNLPPMGKLKINRKKAVNGGTAVFCKLRLKTVAPGGKDPLAEAAE